MYMSIGPLVFERGLYVARCTLALYYRPLENCVQGRSFVSGYSQSLFLSATLKNVYTRMQPFEVTLSSPREPFARISGPLF